MINITVASWRRGQAGAFRLWWSPFWDTSTEVWSMRMKGRLQEMKTPSSLPGSVVHGWQVQDGRWRHLMPPGLLARMWPAKHSRIRLPSSNALPNTWASVVRGHILLARTSCFASTLHSRCPMGLFCSHSLAAPNYFLMAYNLESSHISSPVPCTSF